VKIAILNIYSGLVNRGAETVAQALATRWAENHDVTLFCGGSLTRTNYKVHIVPGVGVEQPQPNNNLASKISHWLYRDAHSQQTREFTYRCLDELAKFEPNIILTFNGSEQIRILQTKSKFRKNIVAGMHGQTENRRWKLAGRENTRMIEMAPAGIVALNEIQYELLKNTAKKKTKIIQISNGVDLDFFNPKADKTRLPLQPPIVLCVAGLQTYKRVELLIRAVAKTNFSLMILGDGPLRDELTIIGTRLLGRSRFEIMTVNHDLIPGIYTAANVFSLPSMSIEAFGVAYLEAMACNLPIVAPDDKVRRSIIGEAGIYTDVTNAKLYGEALIKANNMSWKDIPRIQANKYDWGLISQKYLDFFNELM